jgi:hypothetical protein
MDAGVERMKALIASEVKRLDALKKERTKLENKYINTKTGDFERERIQMRLTKFLLPAIRHLEKMIQSKVKQTTGIERGVEKIKSAQNQLRYLEAQAKRKASAPTRKNHLTPAQRKEVQNFEANLEREFGPITHQNLINESRRMKAEENAILERIMQNWKTAKTQEQKNYYSKMMNAVIDESQYRMMTPEEEREVNAYLAQLEGGKRKGKGKTRRRR